MRPLSRETAFVLCAMLALVLICGDRELIGAGAVRTESSGRERPQMPQITQPVMFNTPAADQILSALQVFPPDNPWNEDISKRSLHPNSKNLVASVGLEKPLAYNLDMAFILVPPDQKRVPVKINGYPDESDPGPYPVPDDAPIEGWPLNGKPLDVHQRQGEGDRHMLVVDPVKGILFEFYQGRKTNSGWVATQASIFDLNANKLRPDGWTSTDAAGLPIFPAVIRYEECSAAWSSMPCGSRSETRGGPTSTRQPIMPAARPT